MKKHIILVAAGSTAFALNALGATLVVDSPDGVTITTSHLGTDTIELLKGAGLSAISISGGAASGNASHGGNVASALLFTQGADYEVDFDNNSNTLHITGGAFALGATIDLNYARFDMDRNGVYETVIETNFGPSADPADDVFTRYAYNDDGSALSVSDAVIAFNNVPEPSSTTLLGLGGLALILRRRK